MIGNTSDDSNSRQKSLAVVLASLVAASMMFMTVTAGVAAAANSDSDTLTDETVSIDNSTEEVYLEVTNSSGDNLNYTVYGVEDGITTQVDSGQISAASGETNQLTLAADSGTYDAYRFVVTEDPTDSDNETAEAIEVGEIVTQSAGDGGGGIFASSGGIVTPMNILIAVLIAAGAYLLGVFDPIKRRIAG